MAEQPVSPARVRLAPGLRARLARGHEQGQLRHGDLGLTLPAYEAQVLARIGSRRSGPAEREDPEHLDAWLAAAAVEDLYLAAACASGAEAAWERLRALLRGPLRGFARARGASAEDAERLADDVLGMLALPPTEGRDGCLLDQYAGSGSLLGFARVLLLRRLARSVGAQARERDVLRSAPTPAPGAASDPAQRASACESAARLALTLDGAWSDLTPRERLALSLKHVDGLSQQEIALLMRVGEPRVSRLLTQALERLRAGLTRRWRDWRDAAGPDSWARLVEAARHVLTTRGSAAAPPAGSAPRPLGPAPTPLGGTDHAAL